jgi:hypothetical protein
MADLVQYFLENDPLKTAVDLIDSADFGSKKPPAQAAEKNTVSVFFLFWTSVFIALTKTLYGDGGFTFLQHFWTTLFIVFVMYISIGIIITIATNIARPRFNYAWVNNKLRCFLTCFIATLTVSLFLVFVADPITRAFVWIIELYPVPLEWVGSIADWGPALLFSAIGCAAIFWMKAEKHAVVYWRWFPIYWLLTSAIFFSLAYDRGWFFDTVMKYSFKILPS